MLARALLIALSCAYAAAIAPLSAAGDDNECALYLTGPGRTSAYDYSLNLLKGNFGYEGQHTCITYDAVNQAYLEARNRIVVSQPKGDWKAEDFASVGELLLDISINLARTYGLTYEEIEKGLPLIDTSRTLIREVCPPIFSHVECRAGKYRRFDGLCTNLQHPTWGATMSPFQRLIGPLFADGINAPRIAHTGRDLPLSRVVSRTMHPDEGFHDHAGTVMVIAWGQFMDHDYTLTGTPLDPVNRNDPEECCKRPLHLKHPYCNEIRVPDDDYFYRLFGVKCIDFVRGFPSPRPGCRLGSRVPFNTLTGVIDGNTVYGVTEKFARKLRTGFGGLLRMNPVFKEYGLKDLLPLKLDIPDEGCTRPNKNMYCFEAGEIRVNEQLVLTVMHTLMAREHNRVARGLAEVNPHWDDETLFQEARRINIAEIQHITYNEFLPILLGKDVMEKFGLVLQKDGYWNGYDPEVNPDVIDSFAAAAYRFGHSLLPTAVERWSKAHKFIASKRLSDLIRRPYDLYRAGVLDEYVMGLMNQVAQAMDDSITQEVTNHLFKKVGARFGMDLVSFNMQRGREFGLPGYMEFRKFCGLSGADSFQDLFGSMPNDTVRKYESIFEHPVDVDLWSGGVSERPLPGSMLGPTFACIIATQFSYSRRGDRFWYELPNQPSSFTPEQLTELRKARLARVICDNTDIIDTVQLYPMVLPDHELNPRVPCRSGIIPSMDFTKWAEPAPFHGPAKQFMTDAYVSSKNDTACTEEKLSEKIALDNKTVTADSHHDEICNNTVETDAVSQNNKVEGRKEIATVAVAINATTKDIINNVDQKCVQDDTVTASNCSNTANLPNDAKDNDKILKYVYNSSDKNNVSKNKGESHPKNSLKRKRRSDNSQITAEDIKVNESKHAPLIVNYETSHKQNQLDFSPLISSGNIIKNSNLVIPQEPSHVEIKLPIHERTSGNVIKNSDLADFNIETLHEKEAQPLKHNKNLNSEVEVIDLGKNNKLSSNNKEDSNNYAHKIDNQSSDSDESIERKENSDSKTYSKSNIKPYSDSNESKEIIESKEYPSHYKQDSRGPPSYNENTSYRRNSGKEFPNNYGNNGRPSKSEPRNEHEPYRGSEESKEKTTYPKYTPKQNQDSFESNEKYNSKQDKIINSDESQEKNESKEYYPSNKKLVQQKPIDRDDSNSKSKESGELESDESNKYSQPRDYSKESNEKEKYDERDKPYRKQYDNQEKKAYNSDKPEYFQTSSENSNESKDLSRENYKDESKNHTVPLKIQDVDLGDFSYERIEVNDKGQVIPAKDSYEENTLPLTTPKSVTLKNKSHENFSSSVEDSNNDSSSGSDEDNKGSIKINAEEIKPVVEINGDHNSGEFISKEPINAISKIKDKNLEAFLGVKDSQENEQSEKIKIPTKEDKGDVKQQFERIPLDYKHDENKDKNKDNSDEYKQKQNNEDFQPLTTEKSLNINTQVEVSEGTIEIIPTDDPKYDEHLKFKFDDVTVSLPEIKLPEDILAYTYEEPHYQKQKKEDSTKPKYYPYESFVKDDDKNSKNPDNNDKEDYDDSDYDRYYDSYKKRDDYKERDNYKKKNDDEEEEEEEDDHADLYEKFVRERFGKQGTFAQRSEKLQNPRPVADPQLYERIKNVLKKTHDIEKQAQKSGDPNAGYMWTLEYGQNL